MSRPTLVSRDRDVVRRRVACGPGRGPVPGASALRAHQPETARTLEDVVVEAWVGLRADAPIACPWCEAAMEPRWSAGAGVVGGRCDGCGTEIE